MLFCLMSSSCLKIWLDEASADLRLTMVALTTDVSPNFLAVKSKRFAINFFTNNQLISFQFNYDQLSHHPNRYRHHLTIIVYTLTIILKKTLFVNLNATYYPIYWLENYRRSLTFAC